VLLLLFKCAILFRVSDSNLGFMAIKGRTSRIMKRYERKWKHICLKRTTHRAVHENAEQKMEKAIEGQEKQLVSQK